MAASVCARLFGLRETQGDVAFRVPEVLTAGATSAATGATSAATATRTVKAHRWVIEAGCERLWVMLNGPWLEATAQAAAQPVELLDIAAPCLEALLWFLYTGELPAAMGGPCLRAYTRFTAVTARQLVDLRAAADRFLLPGLEAACVRRLHAVHPADALVVFAACHDSCYGPAPHEGDVLPLCLAFVVEQRAPTADALLGLSPGAVHALLAEDAVTDTSTLTGDALLRGVVAWADACAASDGGDEAAPAGARALLAPLLPLLRLGDVTSAAISELLVVPGRVDTDTALELLVAKARAAPYGVVTARMLEERKCLTFMENFQSTCDMWALDEREPDAELRAYHAAGEENFEFEISYANDVGARGVAVGNWNQDRTLMKMYRDPEDPEIVHRMLLALRFTRVAPCSLQLHADYAHSGGGGWRWWLEIAATPDRRFVVVAHKWLDDMVVTTPVESAPVVSLHIEAGDVLRIALSPAGDGDGATLMLSVWLNSYALCSGMRVAAPGDVRLVASHRERHAGYGSYDDVLRMLNPVGYYSRCPLAGS